MNNLNDVLLIQKHIETALTRIAKSANYDRDAYNALALADRFMRYHFASAKAARGREQDQPGESVERAADTMFATLDELAKTDPAKALSAVRAMKADLMRGKNVHPINAALGRLDDLMASL